MKHNLTNFPDDKVVFPIECDGGDRDKLCHANEQTYIQNLMDITDWKREFERELQERLTDERSNWETAKAITEPSKERDGIMAYSHGRVKILRELLGEDK